MAKKVIRNDYKSDVHRWRKRDEKTVLGSKGSLGPESAEIRESER